MPPVPLDPGRRRGGAAALRLIVIIVLLAIVVIVFAVVWDDLRSGFREHVGFVGLAAALGATVGASELISRYRDEPLQALLSGAGLTYVGLNALVSGCAYLLLTEYADTLIPGVAGDKWMTARVAE